MEHKLLRQVRLLQFVVGVLSIVTGALTTNTFHAFVPLKTDFIDAQQLRIHEADGTIKAVLSNSHGFSTEGDRAKNGGVPFSGLMFYNQEGHEEGGLVYSGRAVPEGQNSEAALTFDQYHQDQNIYLHHEEHKLNAEQAIIDGLSINSRPDYKQIGEEYALYDQLRRLPLTQREKVRVQALKEGKIGTDRLFLGDRRGVTSGIAYDDCGLFIKNRLGHDALRIYVGYDNKPHIDMYDQEGRVVKSTPQ